MTSAATAAPGNLVLHCAQWMYGKQVAWEPRGDQREAFEEEAQRERAEGSRREVAQVNATYIFGMTKAPMLVLGDFLRTYGILFLVAYGVYKLVRHFIGWRRVPRTDDDGWPVIFKFEAIRWVVFASAIWIISDDTTSFSLMIGVLFLYGAALFIGFSESYMGEWGKELTEKHGEKWTKQLDYYYLTIAAFGVVGVINRADYVTAKISGVDKITAFLLVTALVLRFVKTRAEIGGWNKPEYHNKPTPTQPSADH